MKQIAIVYYSGTGNTQAMAEAIGEGARNAGAEVVIHTSAEFSVDLINQFDAIAFGCPSMGSEVLEEYEFEPMFSACLGSLVGKEIALFGSFGWGDGEWMRNWEADCLNHGAVLVASPIICPDAPDGETLSSCQELGATLVGKSE